MQQRFRSEKRNVFTDEVNKVALNAINDKRIWFIDYIQTYAYGTSKDIIQTNEEIKYKNIIKKTKMVNFDVTGGNIKEHNCLLSTFFAFFFVTQHFPLLYNFSEQIFKQIH